MAFTVEHRVEIPDGALLRAKLVDLEVRDIPKRDGSGTFQKLKWTWEIAESGDLLGKKVYTESDAWFDNSPRCVFRNWAMALLQRDLPTGTTIHEQDLIGLQALVEINYFEDYKDKTKSWPRVTEVIAAGDNFDEPPF